ncbi:hypothetical protein P7C70_g5314, partial [Phenoliferia sp. Uapishka_3]
MDYQFGHDAIYPLPPNPLHQLAQQYQPAPDLDLSQFDFLDNPTPTFQHNLPYHASDNPFTPASSNNSNPLTTDFSNSVHYDHSAFPTSSSDHSTPATPSMLPPSRKRPSSADDDDPILAPSSDPEYARPSFMAPRHLNPKNCMARSLVSGVGLDLPVLVKPWYYLWKKDGGGVEVRVGDKGIGMSPVRVKTVASGVSFKAESESAHKERHRKGRAESKAEKVASDLKRKAEKEEAKAAAQGLEERAKELRRIAEEGDAPKVAKKRKTEVEVSGKKGGGAAVKGGKKEG